MPKWKKSSPELVELLSSALPDDPTIERRTMFGYPCVFINGNMFAGLFADDIFARLPEQERARLLEKGGAVPFEPVPGRIMKEYVVLRDDSRSRAKLKSIIALSLNYGRNLSPKRK